MTHRKNQPRNQPEASPAVPSRSLTRPEDPKREGHYQPMQMHLSAKPPGKSKMSTHLCITIRWGAPPPSYLPVTIGGGRQRSADRRGAAVRQRGAGGGLC